MPLRGFSLANALLSAARSARLGPLRSGRAFFVEIGDGKRGSWISSALDLFGAGSPGVLVAIFPKPLPAARGEGTAA
jgi:hypothetical protein